ncbi:serine/threonine protein kinase [Streptomyces sp. NPDC002734]|uniref:serine/threonine-protein kinase n=1 Tax=Streptomyces sp. NPDC002734 TaxID=3154426 RepID=UPI00331AF092
MTGTEHDGLRGSGATPLREEDPHRVGPVRLLGRLGAGGMGRVYLGVHEGRYVAVKQVLPSLSHEGELFLRRFGHELDNLARLPADSTAPLLVSDRAASPPWFATAYVPGITLGDARLLCGGSLPPPALWPLLREAAQGLVAVHALDMVHRDLKPSNVMLTADGATLIDFGVARAADQTQLTRTDMVIGTPAYMAPEQASGKRGPALTGAVDVFALGSVLACAATGDPPFGDESGPAVLYRIVHEDPDLGGLADVDPELADVVRSCLSKRPQDRPTAGELLRLAEAKGPFAPPLWPGPVADVVAERAEFTRRPVPATPPVPATAPGPVPAPQAGAAPQDGEDAQDSKDPNDGSEDERKSGDDARGEPTGVDAGREPAAAAGKAEREPRRRTRFLPVIIPVVLGVGTTLLVQLLPYVTDADDRAGGPGASVTAPATAGAAVSGAPTERAGASKSPGGSPRPSDEDGEDGKGGDDGKGEKDGGAAGAADGDDADTGSGGTDAGGPDSGSGSGGSGGGTSGGSSGGSTGGSSTTSGGSTGGGVTTGPTIQNVSTSACLTAGPGNASAGSCSGAASSWTFRSVSGGVQIVSQSSGQCLTSYGSVHLGPCGTGGTQVWTRGADGTLRVRSTGECLGVNGFLLLHQSCDGSATQRWR